MAGKVSRDSPSSFLVVGIGASAGGIEAARRLFEALPSATGMAYILIQHLDPTHRSELVAILSRSAKMPVAEARTGSRIEPDHLYVIPPNTNLTISKRTLRLSPYSARKRWQMPIDLFFRSLAENYGGRSVGVVLSGSATDGSLGCRAIKAEGGITFAQDEKSAKFPDMPRSAADAGGIDFILSPEKIAAELARLPRSLGPVSRVLAAKRAGADSADSDIGPILATLEKASGVDFSHYRESTIRRRIARRMLVNKLDSLEKYARYVKNHRDEAEALYEDSLIRVTSFFRDPETFDFIRSKIFPKLLKKRADALPVRIWVPGCATGEEVYSIAICLFEAMSESGTRPPVQIFATDISDSAIGRARAGLYPDSIASEVSEDRLRKFFVRRNQAYQVSKLVREACVFAKQNLGADPPFSNLDMISCRNLLIYMDPYLHQKIFPLFHYALRPGGYLLLGSSETVRSFDGMFEPVDKRRRLFVKGANGKPAALELVRSGIVSRARAFSPRGESSKAGDLQKKADQLLLARFGPPGIVVNANLEIIQFRGQIEPFLEHRAGTASFLLLKQIRSSLALDLRAAASKAKESKSRVRRASVLREPGRPDRPVELEVIPLNDDDGHMLILFGQPRQAESGTPPLSRQSLKPRPPGSRDQSDLKRELASTREYLQSIIGEQEATNEELTSANEEILSANEELQSTNEELETAKEELQSTNEELVTVNEELINRNDEILVAHSDVNNLIASVDIPIVMLDPEGIIRRFTPPAEKLLNLIPSDVGRPIRNIQTNIGAPDLDELVREVARNVEGREREVQDSSGRWYLMRVRPYRMSDNRIDGAVVAFLEIDPDKLGLEQVIRARDYAEALVETVREALVSLDADLKIRTANHAFHTLFRSTEARAAGKTLAELGRWHAPGLESMLLATLEGKEKIRDLEVAFAGDGAAEKILCLNARQVRLPSETRALVLLAIEDITDRREAERRIRESERKFRRIFERAREGILLVDEKSREILDANSFLVDLLGISREDLIGHEVDTVPALSFGDAAGSWSLPGPEGSLQRREIQLRAKHGRLVWLHRVCSRADSDGRTILQWNLRDITESKLLAEELIQSQKLESLGRLAGGIAHDFNNILTIVTSYADKIRRTNGTGGDRAAIEAIESAAERGAGLVRQLLAFGRKGEGGGFENLSVNAIVEETAEMLRGALSKQIAIELRLGNELPPVEGDQTQLQQMLLNLCMNARDAITAQGRIVVETSKVKEPSGNDSVSISVTDDGAGMDEPTRERAFEPFFTTKRERGGSGLGLSVVYGIVTSHGGRIDIQSRLGGGTTIRVLLPASESATEPGRSAATRKKRRGRPLTSRPGTRQKVLVVEDEPLLLESLRDLMEGEGYAVLTARNGKEALELYAREKDIAVVFSDLGMPELGGLPTLSRLRDVNPSAKIILTSGFAERKDRERMTAEGAEAFLSKPYRAEQVLQTIKEVLER